MVILGRLLSAMLKIRRINWYTHDQICRGKNSINDIFPLTIMNVKNSHRRTRPKFGPGFKKVYYSCVLQRDLRMRVTLGTQRAIKIAGGFDRYIYYTPEENFRSLLAVSLKKRMEELISKHPHVKPPPLDKRNPRPVSKKIAKGLQPSDVCDLNKYVFLG